MFIKRRFVPYRGVYNLCFQNITFPIINLHKKYSKEKTVTIFTGNLKKNQYLVSYDSLTDYENLPITKSLPNADRWFFIPIICFLTLSSIMHYFYTPKK